MSEEKTWQTDEDVTHYWNENTSETSWAVPEGFVGTPLQSASEDEQEQSASEDDQELLSVPANQEEEELQLAQALSLSLLHQ